MGLDVDDDVGIGRRRGDGVDGEEDVEVDVVDDVEPCTVASASSGSVTAVGGTLNTPPGCVPSEEDCSSLHACRMARPEASPADDSRKRRRDHP